MLRPSKVALHFANPARFPADAILTAPRQTAFQRLYQRRAGARVGRTTHAGLSCQKCECLWGPGNALEGQVPPRPGPERRGGDAVEGVAPRFDGAGEGTPWKASLQETGAVPPGPECLTRSPWTCARSRRVQCDRSDRLRASTPVARHKAAEASSQIGKHACANDAPSAVARRMRSEAAFGA